MRVDKFLKVSRILKRRSLAAEAAKGGRIKVNGVAAKPSREVKVGDLITVGFNSGSVSLKIKAIKETVRKEEAETLYEITEEEI